MTRRWAVLQSTSMRLALAYAGLFVLSSLLLVGFLWWQTASYLDREIDAVIIADTQAIGERLRDFGVEDAVQTVRDRAGVNGDRNAIFLMTDPMLRPIAGNLRAWPEEIDAEPGWYRTEMRYAGELRATRVFNFGLPGNYHLLVGRDVQDRAAVRTLIIQALGWAIAAAIAMAVLGGCLARRALLMRVETINNTAQAIVQGDLSRRVPTANSADEFDQLARIINRMLGQIEQLIDGVRNVSNTVAHDLRTPLAEVRTRLEGVLRARGSSESGQDEVEGAVEDIDRVIAMSNALLRLAEIDSGVRRAGFRPADLAQIADEVADLYRPLAEARNITFETTLPPAITVDGDSVLLAQAIGNLIDNAIKYLPDGGKMSVTLTRYPNGNTEIAVADNGPGIPDDEKARVTQRFYRSETSRTQAGTGLGLSTVEAVAKLHGGALTLTDNHPGLIAALLLPAARIDATPQAHP